MKQIKNITAAEILKQIKLTVICGEEITETNVCDGFSTWMQQFDASNPYEAFTPESREYFQNKLFVAFAAGMLPAEVTETRTNEVGPDGCWVFTVETAGTLNPYEETEEETEETETETAAPSAPSATEETAAPTDGQTTETKTEETEAVTLAPAEDAQVWDENGETVEPETETEEKVKTSDYLTPEQVTICKTYYYPDLNADPDPWHALHEAEKRPTPADEKWEQLAEWIWLSPRFN